VVGGRITEGLLRRHVGRSADRRSRLCEGAREGSRAGRAIGRRGARRLERLGDAEVGDHRRAPRQQHVLRLDVAVHDAARVRALQGGEHVAQDAQGGLVGDRPEGEPRPQRLPLHERHRVVRQPVGHRPSGEHRDDVRVLEPGGEADLTREALGGEPFGQLGGEHLDDDLTPERLVARDEDAAHAAAPELALQGVGRAEGGLELVADGDGHGGRMQQAGPRLRTAACGGGSAADAARQHTAAAWMGTGGTGGPAPQRPPARAARVSGRG
jgi:hypothetical protein